jgi:hypothetical protein
LFPRRIPCHHKTPFPARRRANDTFSIETRRREKPKTAQATFSDFSASQTVLQSIGTPLLETYPNLPKYDYF